MTADPGILFYNLAVGIGVGAVIVFAGVWIVTGWRLTRPLTRAVLLIVLVAAPGAAFVSFLRVAPAGFVAGFLVAAVTFVLCSVLLALHRLRVASRRRRRRVWPWWAMRAVAETLVLPMAIFGFAIALVATGALFTTIQQGPQTERLLFELSIVTATCWAMVMVGGVWARRRSIGR